MSSYFSADMDWGGLWSGLSNATSGIANAIANTEIAKAGAIANAPYPSSGSDKTSDTPSIAMPLAIGGAALLGIVVLFSVMRR